MYLIVGLGNPTAKYEKTRHNAGWDLADHVLGRFSPEDREKFDDAVKEAVDAVTLMVQDRTDEAMNRYNRKK